MYRLFFNRILNTVSGMAVLGLVFSGSVQAYTYTAWTAMTGTKTFAINPFVYGDFSDVSGTSIDLVVGYGLSDNIDLFVNVATLSPVKDFAYGGSYVMPRYDFGNNNIIALQLGYDGTGFAGGPHYHFFWENDKYAFEANAVALFYSSAWGDPYAYGSIGNVWKAIPGVLSPFLELNPSYQFGSDGGFDFVPAPGVWLGIPNTTNQISVSVPIKGILSGEISAGFGIWYWLSFGGK